MKKVKMHARVHGRVQGVFFRNTTKERAKAVGITGTVRNLADGSVEIFAVGKKDDLEAFMNYLSSDEGPGHVTKTELTLSEPTCLYEGFQIIF